MKEQTIRCEDCTAVVAYVFDRDDRRKMRFTFGAPLARIVDGQPGTVDIHSQWFTIDIDDELDDVVDSTIEVECECGEKGNPKRWTFLLRATLETLGTRRGIAIKP